MNCIITENYADNRGGGIFSIFSSFDLHNCTISKNIAYSVGGGIYCEWDDDSFFLSINNCDISENKSSLSGGGLCCYFSQLTLTGCTIKRNKINENQGGGISLNDCTVDIRNCDISENKAYDGSGGGFYIYDGFNDISNSVIMQNEASHNGGGIRIYTGYHVTSKIINNCIIASNTSKWGGGIYHDDEYNNLSVTNCTITNNIATSNGGGIYFAGYFSSRFSPEGIGGGFVDNFSGGGREVPEILNTILWNDSPDETYVEWWENDPEVTYSNVQGGWEGVGNIDTNPMFIPFAIYGFEYLLRPNSPCIDTGDPTIEDALYDWHPRWPDWYPDGARSDMGAYGGPGNDEWLEWLKQDPGRPSSRPGKSLSQKPFPHKNQRAFYSASTRSGDS